MRCWVISAGVFFSLLPAAYVGAQILEIEREALIALYNATDGANWNHNEGWMGAVGTECTWYEVHCAAGHVTELSLAENSLRGTLPPELGSLSRLEDLWLYSNQLSGVIPPELESASSLRKLSLRANQLSGSIPPELGNLPSLQYLTLAGNQLSGRIPPELGNLASLQSLFLDSNQLSGEIPAELENLSTLTFLGGLTLMHNALHTESASLIEFINLRHWYGYDWQGTQTIAPTDVTAISPSPESVLLSWTPILYTDDPGGYRISFSTNPGGPYTFFDITTDKLATSLRVRGLPPATYYFVVETQTDSNDHNQNTVISEPSDEVQGVIQVVPIPVLHPGGVVLLISALLAAGLWVLRSKAMG